MSRVADVAEQYVPNSSAFLHIEGHARKRLAELRIATLVSEAASRNVIRAIIQPNWVRDRIAYLQDGCGVVVRVNRIPVPFGVLGPLTRKLRGLHLAFADVA
jgi:hypothetical protein